MTSKFYLRFLQIGIIASLMTVFFVFPTLLFPYITSKQLTFNILTEFLLLFWAIFIWKFPAYRPKKSFITWGVLAFITGITLSCFVSVDPILSFWGDAERMLGVFHVLHFFFFYLILISTFRNWRDWQTLLYSSITIATLVSLKGIIGETYSTIGNTAYVSGYIIFNLYFCALLFFRNKSSNRWFLLIPVLLMMWEFTRTHTSGAIIGLGLSILLILFLVGVLSKEKKKKIATWSLLAVSIILLVAVFSQQNTDWFQKSFLRNLTSQKATFQTRLISWKAAAKGFPENPLLGVGFGNYALVFDKYFDADFYDYTRGETYFDRAHNNVVEIISTTGLVGLASYLSIFIAVLFYLLKILRKDKNNFEVIILFGLFTAYFIQNLAIFDSLVTYIGLMISLAYVYHLSQEDVINHEISATEKNIPEFTTITIGLIFVLLFTSYCNIRPLNILSDTIDSYSLLANGYIVEGFDSYQKTFTVKHPLDRDSKSALINIAIATPGMFTSVEKEKGLEYINYVISLAEENLANNPQDNLMNLQLAQVYVIAINAKLIEADVNSDYLQKSLYYLDRAIEASPDRVPIYIMKASVLGSIDKFDEAVAVLEQAAAIKTDFPDAYCQLYRFYSSQEDTDLAQKNADTCIDLDGAMTLSIGSGYINLLNFYYESKDWSRAIKMAKNLTEKQNTNQAWELLAEIYKSSGDFKKSQEAFSRSVMLKPKTNATSSFR